MRWTVLNGALLESRIVCHLGLVDLARLQATDVTLRESLGESGAWSSCASATLPGLDIDPALLSTSQRQRLARCFPELLQAHFAEDLNMKISSPEDIEEVAQLARSAQRAASVHAANGGGASCVTIGKIRFPHRELERAMEKRDPLNMVVRCDSIPLAVSKRIMDVLQSTGGRLEVQFALGRDGLFVRLWDSADGAELPTKSGGRCLLGEEPPFDVNRIGAVVDVRVRDAAFTLHQRGGVAEIDGAWRKMGPGVHAAVKGRRAACDALARGSLCAVSIREGTRSAFPSLAQALHLERTHQSDEW